MNDAWELKRRDRRSMLSRLSLCLPVAFAALVAPALAQESGNAPYWISHPVIEAVGRARTEHVTDEARFSVTFEETARDAGEASARAADRARLAAAAMRSRGGGAIEVRSVVEVAAIHEQYVDDAGARRDNTAADRVRGYVSRVRLDVRVRDASRVSDVMSAALATGPENASEPRFVLQDTVEAHRSVFTLATADAARRAQSVAAATGARLGRLLVVQEGQGPCIGRAGPPGYYSTTAIPVMLDSPPAPQTADVSVTGERGALILTARQIERLQLPNDTPTVAMEAFVCVVFAVGDQPGND